MESMQLDAGMWSVDLKLNVGSHQIVFTGLSLGEKREKKPELKGTQGHAIIWKLGPWLECIVA